MCVCVCVCVCVSIITCCLYCVIKAPPPKPKGNAYADKLKYDHQMLLYRKEHAKWQRDTQTQSKVGIRVPIT